MDAPSNKPHDHLWLAILFASINACMLGGMGLFAKLLAQYFQPLEVTFFRNAFSLIALTIWLIASGSLSALKTSRPWDHVIRGAVGTAGIALGMWAISLLSLAETTALLFTSPLFTALFSVLFLKEKIGPFRTAAIIAGFCGILIIANPFGTDHQIPLLGLAVGLGWGLCSGAVDTILRWIGTTEKSTTTTFYFMLFGTITCGLHWPFAEIHEASFSLPAWGIIAGLGTCGLISLLSKSQSFRLGQASVIAPFMYTMIIWSVLFDYLFWDKIPAWNVALGIAVIVGANLTIIYREHKKSKHPAPTLPEQ